MMINLIFAVAKKILKIPQNLWHICHIAVHHSVFNFKGGNFLYLNTLWGNISRKLQNERPLQFSEEL